MANGALDDLAVTEMENADSSELIVLGSGSSTGVPSPLCLINPTDPRCEVCHMAMKGPPELNRNYRLIRVCSFESVEALAQGL